MTTRHTCVASSPDLLAVAEEIAGDWERLDVQGHLFARHLDTGEELGFEVDTPVPLASVAKVAVALAVLERTTTGALDPACQVTVDPDTKSVGPTGVAAYRYPTTVAVGDLVFQMLSVSDNAAADTLIDLLGIDAIQQSLRDWACPGIRFRHGMNRMYECAAGAAGNDFGMALELAIRPDASGAYAIETLDPDHGNSASAAALVDFLQRVWLDQIADRAATAELRRLMRSQVFNHRLSADLRTDSVQVSGKTGTFLHLRHEIGVIETDTGDRVAIAALTRSTRKAQIAQDIDLAIGAAARSAFESLRT